MASVEGDAIPFDLPKTEENENNDIPKERPKEVKEEKERNQHKSKKKKHFFSSDDSETDSDSDDDDDDDFLPKNTKQGTYISIKKGKNIHIGNSYSIVNMNTAVSNVKINSNSSKSSKPSSDYESSESEEVQLPDDLINSSREIDRTDMYEVAKHITDWKKLARYLPPGDVFGEGELSNFEINNLHNTEEAIIQMFTDWKEKFPEYATVGNLAKTLRKIKKSGIAIKLKP